MSMSKYEVVFPEKLEVYTSIDDAPKYIIHKNIEGEKVNVSLIYDDEEVSDKILVENFAKCEKWGLISYVREY
jgi:hypothetical protein